MKLSIRRSQAAFTMVEIALCLAIVGFALVAIIGVLPTGMNVQRDNRNETIINQDAAVWMDAIRSGAQGYDDLTNWVVGITNYWTPFTINNGVTNAGNSGIDSYTIGGSHVTSIDPPPICPLTNGFRIVGLMSTPRYLYFDENHFQSNYVVAYFRAMSGSAVDKRPQQNQDVLNDAFAYRLILENTPYVPIEDSSTNAPDVRYRTILQRNSRDLRLTFRWPVLPNGSIGNGRQTYRLFVGGHLTQTNDVDAAGQPLFFFEPSTYVQAQ